MYWQKCSKSQKVAATDTRIIAQYQYIRAPVRANMVLHVYNLETTLSFKTKNFNIYLDYI